MRSFPKDFVWGTAASAYQTEGGNFHNDWFHYEQSEPRIKEPCGLACDHWNRYAQDYDLAKELGVQMHRLSIEWSRVCPRPGEVCRPVLDHYREMLEALHARGIRVMLCLHHFTIPQWVQELGGFLKRKEYMCHFNFYVETVVGALGDLVDSWLPINEPNMVPLGGYLADFLPPFKINPLAFIRCYRTFFAMHAQSYRIIKQHYPEAPVGVAFAFMYFKPYNERSRFDQWAAKLAISLTSTRFFEGVQSGKMKFPFGLGGNMPDLRGSMDFIGLNYYSINYMKGLTPVEARPGDEVTEMGWSFYPEGIYEVLAYLHARVDLPIIITENGLATNDDDFRIRYMRSHLEQVHRAIQEGMDIRGYMCWSLTDNFEWDHGFEKRFGLIHVDYKTQQRSIKPGGRWYAGVIRANAIGD